MQLAKFNTLLQSVRDMGAHMRRMQLKLEVVIKGQTYTYIGDKAGMLRFIAALERFYDDHRREQA